MEKYSGAGAILSCIPNIYRSMMMGKLTLNDIHVGERARIVAVSVRGGMRRRLQDLGFLENAELSCELRANSGEPAAFLVCGALIALREEEMKAISVERLDEEQLPEECSGCIVWG